jgi:hypothetical protein
VQKTTLNNLAGGDNTAAVDIVVDIVVEGGIVVDIVVAVVGIAVVEEGIVADIEEDTPLMAVVAEVDIVEVGRIAGQLVAEEMEKALPVEDTLLLLGIVVDIVRVMQDKQVWLNTLETRQQAAHK